MLSQYGPETTGCMAAGWIKARNLKGASVWATSDANPRYVYVGIQNRGRLGKLEPMTAGGILFALWMTAA